MELGQHGGLWHSSTYLSFKLSFTKAPVEWRELADMLCTYALRSSEVIRGILLVSVLPAIISESPFCSV